MDWSSVSRLIPELGVLVVVGYFAFKGIGIFRDIIDKIDQNHHDALAKLADSIDKNTSSNKELIKSSKEQTAASREVTIFMKNLNGKLEKAVKKTIKDSGG